MCSAVVRCWSTQMGGYDTEWTGGRNGMNDLIRLERVSSVLKNDPVFQKESTDLVFVWSITSAGGGG